MTFYHECIYVHVCKNTNVQLVCTCVIKLLFFKYYVYRRIVLTRKRGDEASQTNVLKHSFVVPTALHVYTYNICMLKPNSSGKESWYGEFRDFRVVSTATKSAIAQTVIEFIRARIYANTIIHTVYICIAYAHA